MQFRDLLDSGNYRLLNVWFTKVNGKVLNTYEPLRSSGVSAIVFTLHCSVGMTAVGDPPR
jgi:hypothetical protein